jgi:RNA polymerase sigma-70 factor (ECF subfamily)
MTIRRHEVSTVSFENVDVSDMASTDDVLNHIENLDIDSNLQRVLETLSFEQQHLLKLRFFADLELVEIAMVTNTPLGTAKSRLHRALVSLRLQLQMERPTA